MTEGIVSGQLETYWGPKPPLTEDAFSRVVEENVVEVVLEPHMEGPKGKNALAFLL